jgi:hypothetical protein
MTTTKWKRWAVPAAIALALLPFVASAIALIAHVGGSYHPQADQALIEMQIRDIGRSPVLLGPYSRFGWFHPGPALFYLLWLPYRITGSGTASILFAALAVNAATVVAIVLVARRRGGLPLVLLTLVLLGLFVRSTGPLFFRDPWNPSITVLPFVLLVFLAWSLGAAERWALPVAAGVASFLVQTHVSYALPAATVVGVGVAGAALTDWRRRADEQRDGRLRSWLGAGVVTAVVLFVFWLPVVVQQLTRDPGNLGTVVRFFRDHGREHSYGDAWHVVASQLAPWPEWLRGASRVSIFTGAVDLGGSTPLAVAAVALAGATVLAWFKARDAFRLDCIVAAGLVAAFVAVSRIVGEIFPYLVRWTWALGMLTWLAIGWSFAAAWLARPDPRTDRDRRVGQVTLAVFAAALVALTVVNAVDAARAGNLDERSSKAVPVLSREVRAALPSGDGIVEIQGIGGAGSGWIGAGIADDLERRGISTRAAPDLFFYGPDRILGDEKVRLVVLPVEDPDLPQARKLAGFEERGRVGNVTLFVKRP